MAYDRSSWPAQSGGRRDAIAAEIDAESASFWQATATRLAREINLGWWLAGWLPWAVGVGLVGTFAMLATRLRGGSPGWVWTGIALLLGAAAIVAWQRNRHRFETTASARVRLEEALGLKARLTAASAGVGSWPDRPAVQALAWPVRWRWERPAVWGAVVAALLVIAARLPVADARSARKHAIERPTDARVVDSWLDELAREQAVDERSIERVRQRIAELMERTPRARRKPRQGRAGRRETPRDDRRGSAETPRGPRQRSEAGGPGPRTGRLQAAGRPR